MSKLDQNTNLTENTDDLDDFKVPEVPKKSKLEMLKERATQLGITYSPNIGEETLARKIQDKLEGENIQEALAEREEKNKPISKAQAAALKRRDAMKLVRVVVSPMDPLRQQLEGEIVTGGNSLIGTISKYVPFNNENGFHIPEILYKILRDRKYMSHYTVTDSKGREINRHRLAPAYSIVVLPPLTDAELKAIARDQRARQGSTDYED